jgi:aminoglycoside N3'-acetyltransferase
MEKRKRAPITKNRLITDLKKLGVAFGDTLMLHASVKPLGWVVGVQTLFFKLC